MLEIKIGEKGLHKTWQWEFKKTTKCVHCGKEARIGFVLFEKPDVEPKKGEYICELHDNKKHSMWFHDCIACAVYFCEECLKATALCNQA